MTPCPGCTGRPVAPGREAVQFCGAWLYAITCMCGLVAGYVAVPDEAAEESDFTRRAWDRLLGGRMVEGPAAPSSHAHQARAR